MYIKEKNIGEERVPTSKIFLKDTREKAKYINSRILKRRRKRNYFIYYILLLLFVTLFAVTLSVTFFFNIKEIEVLGISKYTHDDIINSSGIKKGDNLFRISIPNIINKMTNQLLYVDNIEMHRILPDKLKINISESKGIFSLKQGDVYNIISGKGRVLELNSPNAQEYSILVEGIESDLGLGQFIFGAENDRLNLLEKLYNELEALRITGVSSINLHETYDIKLTYDNRIDIDIGSFTDVPYKLNLCFYVIKNKLGANERGTIDIRNSQKAIFKPLS